MIRYGILSTASIVPRFVAALNDSGTGTAAAIASRNLEAAKQAAEQLGIPKAYGSYDELFQDPEIDAVYVAMINSLHYEYAKKALEAEKHVIVEKPMTLHVKEAEELFRLAKEKNLFITEAQKSVFLPVYQDILQFLKEGKLGTVHMMDFSSSCAATYNGWLHSAEAGGGALFGNAGYSLSLARMLGGELSEVTGLATFGNSQVEEQCVLNMNIGGKILGVSRISTNVLAENGLVIWGDNGSIRVPDYWKARTAYVTLNNGETLTFDHPCAHELVYEVEHFNSCIAQGLTESIVTSCQITTEIVRIMESLSETWRNRLW